MSFSVQVDDREVRAALTRLAQQGQHLQPVLKSIGQVLVTVTDLTFRESRDPWGTPWADLSELTLLRRGRGAVKGQSLTTKAGHTRAAALKKMLNAKPLRDRGQLASSFSAQVSGDEVRVGSGDIRAGTHQFGAGQGAYGRTKRGGPIPWGDIPARPMLPIRDGAVDLPADDRADILDIITQKLEAAL